MGYKSGGVVVADLLKIDLLSDLKFKDHISQEFLNGLLPGQLDY